MCEGQHRLDHLIAAQARIADGDRALSVVVGVAGRIGRNRADRTARRDDLLGRAPERVRRHDMREPLGRPRLGHRVGALVVGPLDRVAGRVSPQQAMENLQLLEQTQRLLASNVQEALAVEVGLLMLKL